METEFNWPGCDYQCIDCGNVKRILTNTYMTKIWERCTDNCSWGGSFVGRGPMIRAIGGGETGFYKRSYVILEHTRKDR